MKTDMIPKTAIIPPSIRKKIRVKSGGNSNSTYDIEIESSSSSNDSRLQDTIEAESLVDAYSKAQDIIKKLSEKLDREDGFYVVSITRNS